MSPHRASSTDRRIARTRKAIDEAFVSLLEQRRYDEINVGDIADRANIGRSTFYEHFRSRDELLNESMRWLLVIIANAAMGSASDDELQFAMAHVWQNRRLGRAALEHPRGLTVRRMLAALISERLPPSEDLRVRKARATQIAGAQLALLEGWVSGDISASETEIASFLRAGGQPSKE